MADHNHKVYESPLRVDEGKRIWYKRLSDASFPAPGMGWVVGAEQILSTRDGGRNWINLYRNSPPHSSLVPGRVSAVDKEICWVISGISVSQHQGYYTSDGGETWKAAITASDFYPNAIFFINPTHGWIVGDDAKIPTQDSKLFWTIDGGGTWHAQRLGIKARPHLVRFFDQDRGVLLVNKLDEEQNRYLTHLYYSEDAGRTWKHLYSFNRSVHDFDVLDSGHFFVGGEKGFIAESVDGGSSWKRSHTHVRRNINFIGFRNNKVGVAGGDYGLLMFTSDGGQTWRRHAGFGERMNFIKAAFTEKHLILVGERSIYLLDLRSVML
jgi:photosystem II stability/assembly factor-like uncharacterized protein